MADRYDLAIIGGGIVGLATARALTERAPRASVVILEKEDHIGAHQTGHNSGVIHSGIYYKPGSYKARLCVEGKNLMYAFCEQHGIKVERCGKVIVATSDAELPRLQMIYERGQANGVPCELIEGDRLRELEPRANALRGIHSPSTGIIDYKDVMSAMKGELGARGVSLETGARVMQIARTPDGLVVVETSERIEPQLPLDLVTTRRYGSARITVFTR
jgi:L-2-hydroxyglutarate oxidase LhgO